MRLQPASLLQPCALPQLACLLLPCALIQPFGQIQPCALHLLLFAWPRHPPCACPLQPAVTKATSVVVCEEYAEWTWTLADNTDISGAIE